MTAEIIAVGTELLLGDILNTNAQFLARELASLGIGVYYQSVVGDNAARLEALVRTARERSDLLVFTGGLGPTDDDLTKQTVAKAYGDTLRFDPEELEKIRSFFERWGRTMPPSNEKQAYVPVHGRKIVNNNGTAPGMIFEDTVCKGKYAVLLPGPPKEMQPMFLDTVKPWLAQLSDGVLFSRTLRVTGVGESHMEPKISDLLDGTNPTAALYAKMGEVVIRVTAKAATQEQAAEMCADTVRQLKDRLGDVVYTDTFDSLEETVVDTLKQTHKTVATAESCTGGLLSQRLTAIPGSSEVFSLGVCTYSNEMKKKMLGVPAQMLEQVGAVSPQVAAAMAQGVRACAGADFGVGITGIAGPGGATKDKPVGLVYVSACDGNVTYVQKLLMTNRTRDSVRTWASQHALEMVRRLTLGLEQPGCCCFHSGEPVVMPAEAEPMDV